MRIKFNFYVILFIVTLTIAYFFDFVPNSIPNIIVFFSNSLFSSVESKIKYLSTSPSKYIRLHDQHANIKDSHCKYFHNHQFFNCNISNVVNTNVFVRFFVNF